MTRCWQQKWDRGRSRSPIRNALLVPGLVLKKSTFVHGKPSAYSSRLVPLMGGVCWNGAIQKFVVSFVPSAQRLQSDQSVVVS